jgi:hypothetical protein
MTIASRARWTEQHYPDPGAGTGPEGDLLFSIIYRPGGVDGANVVTTWPQVQAAVDAVQGTINIYVDSSIEPATVPAGNWNGHGAAVLLAFDSPLVFNRAAPPMDPPILTIEDGATLQNYAKIDGLVVVCNCVTTPAFSFSQFADFIVQNFASIIVNAGALVAPIQITAPGFSFALVSSLGTLDNSLAPTVPVINIAAGSTMTFYMRDAAPNFSALFTGNEIGGPVGSKAFWENDASVPPLASSLFFGTIVQAGTALFLGPNVGSTGAAPTVAPGAAAGVGATATVDGNDTAGRIDLTTGIGSTAGDYVDVTFASAFTSTPKSILVGGANVNVPNDILPYVDAASVTTTGFSISTPEPGVDSTLFQFYYIVVG